MTESTNARNCLLREKCRTTTDPTVCNRLCPHFISLHGASGTGGRAGSANVPSDYRLVTVQNAVCRTEQTDAYKVIDRYVATFVRQFGPSGDGPRTAANGCCTERVKSLYLYSESPGTGKTTTACAVLNEWIAVHYIGSLQRGQTPAQRPAYFLDVNEWQKIYNKFSRDGVPRSVKEPAAEQYYRWMDYAMEAPFAVLDDIGVRSATEAFRGDVHSIVNHRVTNRLPTVYTSNVTVAELAEVFDARLADRVRDECAVLSFKGESKRGMRR